MKKAFVVLMLLICGCEPYGIDNKGVAHATDVKDGRGYFSVINVEVYGETHEYLMFHASHQGGITHLPNCKYCKNSEEK